MSQARTGETPYTQHRHLGATGLRAKKRAIASSTVIGSDLSADLKQENIDSKEPQLCRAHFQSSQTRLYGNPLPLFYPPFPAASPPVNNAVELSRIVSAPFFDGLC